jgi:nucleotide-binding universal stress UspA family protein
MVTDTPDEYKRHIAALTAKYLKAAKDAATAAGVACDGVHVEHEHPYEAIIDTARKGGCDAIVMASMVAAASQRSYSVAKQLRCSPTALHRLSSFVGNAAAYCRRVLRAAHERGASRGRAVVRFLLRTAP